MRSWPIYFGRPDAHPHYKSFTIIILIFANRIGDKSSSSSNGETANRPTVGCVSCDKTNCFRKCPHQLRLLVLQHFCDQFETFRIPHQVPDQHRQIRACRHSESSLKQPPQRTQCKQPPQSLLANNANDRRKFNHFYSIGWQLPRFVEWLRNARQDSPCRSGASQSRYAIVQICFNRNLRKCKQFPSSRVDGRAGQQRGERSTKRRSCIRAERSCAEQRPRSCHISKAILCAKVPARPSETEVITQQSSCSPSVANE